MSRLDNRERRVGGTTVSEGEAVVPSCCYRGREARTQSVVLWSGRETAETERVRERERDASGTEEEKRGGIHEEEYLRC